jgi:hypothetical protein
LSNPPESGQHLASRHLRFGWAALLGFTCLGIGLEALHGFKVEWYLDVANDTRRHLFTLAHAHGTLLALVNLAFAATIGAQPRLLESRGRLASSCLIGASLLMPMGFLLGGVVIHAGDPGLGIALLPIGAILLVVAVALVVRGVWAR